MDEELQPPQPEPKISEVEIILFGILFIICDIIELIPLAGDVMDIVVGAPFDFYIFFKGLKGAVAFIDQIIEAIPAVQELPLWTFSWAVIVWLDRHPKIERHIEIAGAIGGGIDGAGGELAEKEMHAGEAAGQSSAKIAGATEAEPDAHGSQHGEMQRTGEGANGAETDARSENARPSEKSAEQSGENKTERASENQESENREEDTKKKEKEDDYEKMMEAEAEIPPIEQATKELFSEQGPAKKQQGTIESENPQKAAPQENESTRKLRERFEKAQKVRDQLEKLNPSERDRAESDGEEKDDLKNAA